MRARVVYAAVVVFVTMLGLALANVAYTNHVDTAAEHRNQQRARDFCGVVVLIDDRYQQLPPAADPVAKQFAAAIHDYRLKLGC